MKEIPLTQGFTALVDDDDHKRLTQHKWFAHFSPDRRQVRAARKKPAPERGMILMHREILQAGPGQFVDHRRHREAEFLVDNCKSNLRIATGTQNQANRRMLTAHSSIFKGVTWNKLRGRWQAATKVDQKSYHLGLFEAEAHAALAYDLAAVKHFGEFALTNFPVPSSTNWLYGPEVMHG